MITYYVAALQNDSPSRFKACDGHGDLKSVSRCVDTQGSCGDYPVAMENGVTRALTPNEQKEYDLIRFNA